MKKFLFLLLTLGLLSIPLTTRAQISLTPLYESLEASANGQSQTTFSVSNGSSEPVRFRASFLPFTFNETSIDVRSVGDLAESDLSPYLRAAPLEFEVPAFSEQIVRVVALVPPSTLGAELRSALIVEPLLDLTTPPEASEESDEEIRGRIFYTYRFVAQIYMSSPEHTASLSVQYPQYTPANALQLVFKNAGLVSGISNTTWQLNRGEELVAKSEEAARFIVLPNDGRVGTLVDRLALEPGEYTLTGTFGVEDGGEPPVVLNPQPFTKTFTVE